MPFTNPSFPGQIFATFEEFEEAQRKRIQIEGELSKRAKQTEEVVRITATIIPASREVLEERIADLQKQVQSLYERIESLASEPKPAYNKEGLLIGTILQGESVGEKHTLEVLEEGYLCSDGKIYDSLSGAALGVSGNRRSGWKFWKDVAGISIGEISGRFDKHAESNPFDPR